MKTSSKDGHWGYETAAAPAQGAAAPVPLLQARGLCQRLGGTWVLRHLELSVSAGEVVWLVGDNGAGKSTLLRLLAGLGTATAGQIDVFGLPVAHLGGPMRRRLGLMGHAHFCHEALGGLDNLTWAARLMGHAAPAARQLAAERLQEVGLATAGQRPLHAYSAGMRRRLALARLLLGSPELMLADEPFAQLDPPGQALAQQCFARRLAAGATLVFTSHQAEPAVALGGRCLRLHDGQLQPSAAGR